MKVISNMSGWVVAVHVKEGQSVEVGAELITLESMKMQITNESPVSGRVQAILVSEEDVVQEGETLVVIS